MAYFNAGEVQIFYQTQGKGFPLLLIHGLGSSSRDWEMQIDQFAKRFLVIAIDLRGHGRSDKPPGPYSMSIFAADTANLLEGLGHFPAHILGISLGGMVAFQLALDYPQLVKKLVIVNSVPELVPQGIKDILGYWQRLAIVQMLGMKKMGQVLAGRLFPEPDQEPLREILIKRWSANHKPSYLASLKATYGWSVQKRLGEIIAPTLVIGADGDYFPTKEKEIYTALIPQARLVEIENSRHATPAEKPEEFNQVVEEFLVT